MEEKLQMEAEHIKCESCGGELSFSPETGTLICPYCGHTQELEANGPVAAHDYTGSSELNTVSVDENVTAHCENCGATITYEKNSTAQKCPFCNSPMTIDSGLSAAPDGVLPFQVTQKAAIQSFRDWIRGKFFSPKALRTLARMQKIFGVYVPHFLFSCRTESQYTAEAGTHYYETEIVTVEKDGQRVQEERKVMKTSWRPVSGPYGESFADQSVNASKNVDRKLIKLEFGLDDLKPYTKEYLFGFQAENNSISLSDCWEEEQKEIREHLTRAITSSIAADEVRNLHFSTDYQDVKYQYVLMPVWISTYTFKGKLYKVMINGQTGQIKGEAPLSAARILLSILLTVGIPALLYTVNTTLGILSFIIAVITLIVLANRKPKKDK